MKLGVVGKANATVVEGADVARPGRTPARAADYVAATGVDALAVGHRQRPMASTPGCPRLTSIVCGACARRSPCRWFLHGGSGTPDDDLQRAISLGIAKVNVATDLVSTVRESLLEQWQAGRKPWIPQAQEVAMEAMAAVVERWIGRTGAAGRA